MIKTLPKQTVTEITLEDCISLGSEKPTAPKWLKFCSRWLTYRKDQDWKVKVKITTTESTYVTLTNIENGKLFRAKLRFSHHPMKYGQTEATFFLDVTKDIKVTKAIKEVKKVYKAWKKQSSDNLDVVKTY